MEVDDQKSLRYSCELGYLDRVQSIVQNPAIDLNYRYHNNMTALHYSLLNYHPHIALYLIAQGVNVTLKDSMGFTAFHLACRRGYVAIAEQLFNSGGGDINLKDINSYTPLSLACRDQSVDVITFLLSKNCELNVQDKYGWTALHHACSMIKTMTSQAFEIARWLIMSNADITVKDKVMRELVLLL